MRALHPRVLFVAGVPRSGTTLVEQFIQMHGGVVALPSDPLTREPLSLSNGGSGRCLADFCNTLGNSRFARNATARAIRLDVAGLLGHVHAGCGANSPTSSRHTSHSACACAVAHACERSHRCRPTRSTV